MLVAILNDSSQTVGGGWTFNNYLSQGLHKAGVRVVLPEEADVCIIPSSSMVVRDTVVKAKKAGKKIVLRVDNIPRNSRNRNTGTSRLKDYAQMADAVVYQSQWSLETLLPFLQCTGKVIYNGTDTDVFSAAGKLHSFDGDPIYLYSRFNRDETKGWEMVWYEYQKIHNDNPRAGLVIVGRFSDEQRQYNFDFFNGERFVYLEVITNRQQMAEIYRGCNFFLASYFNDACSNTYIEALCAGMEIQDVEGMTQTGGTPEILNKFRDNGPAFFSYQRMTQEYIQVFERVL